MLDILQIATRLLREMVNLAVPAKLVVSSAAYVLQKVVTCSRHVYKNCVVFDEKKKFFKKLGHPAKRICAMRRIQRFCDGLYARSGEILIC